MNRELVSPARGRLSGKYFAIPLIVVSLALQASTVSIAKTRRSTFSPAPAPVPDPGYASALAAANRFLQAWQNQDHETGLLMLTDTAKQNSSAERLEVFFTSGHEAAYEIARGKKLKAGCYAFPVALFTSVTGVRDGARPQRSQIVVVRSGKDEWAIDKLP